jgi:Uma2 family endonuclease
MATTTSPHSREVEQAPRFVFDGVRWEDREATLRIVGNRPIRVTYERGTMELMSPLCEHGSIGYLLARMVDVLTEELDVPDAGADPDTLKRQDLEKGVEPDHCYYLGDHAEVIQRKTRIEMGIDPPPDLVIEADLTRSSVDRLAIFAALGIHEVWRFADGSVEIHVLNATKSYRTAAASDHFPSLTVDELIEFVESGRAADSTTWDKTFRASVRTTYIPRARRQPNGAAPA